MLSLKYEVDHGYYLVDSSKKLSEEEKKIEFINLEKKGKNYNINIIVFVTSGILAFVAATGLIINRGKILDR